MAPAATMRRRRGTSSVYRPPYSASDYPNQSLSFSARLPTFLVLLSFLFGWLIGRDEASRNKTVEIGLKSATHLRSMGNSVMILAGLSVNDECESSDGRGNFAFCSVSQLLGKLMRERVVLERRMESAKAYGSYYRQIFNDMSTKPTSYTPVTLNTRTAGPAERLQKQTPLFVSTPNSTRRLIRRILLKHTQAVIRDSVAMPNIPKPTFTWVTAGDSAAAGHGNLYSQSYTAVLQDTVEDAFKALGITFQAKNYAMGQYSSAPELALCMREVFGNEIDALMWDFASLQPSLEPLRRTILWGNRAGMHPTRPILFSYDTYGMLKRDEIRFSKLRDLEFFAGMSAVMMDSESMWRIREKLPNSIEMKDPSVLPEALQYYNCDRVIEGGVRCNDPMRNFFCYIDDEIDSNGPEAIIAKHKKCRKKKFSTKPDCSDARYQVSWHPGWKDHMLKGRLIGHFFINVLNEALFELEKLKYRLGDNPKTILAYLERADARDAYAFEHQPPDTEAWDEDGVLSLDMSANTLLRGQTICHTALLPSKSRLEGITTESDLVGDEFGGFDKGVNQFLMSGPENGLVPLAFDMNDRQHCELLEVDHKDFFLVREQDGWVSMTVPNERELEVYKRTSQVQGIIVICLKICPLNKCPDAYISIDEVSRRSKLFITVDGKTVTKVHKLDGCHILVGDGGIRWGTKDQFELRFRINDPGTQRVLKISSVIVF